MTTEHGRPGAGYSLETVGALLDVVREELGGLRTDVQRAVETKVSRGEWELRNSHVDARFQEQGREIGQLRTQAEARRVPWTSVGAFVVAAAALGINIMVLISA